LSNAFKYSHAAGQVVVEVEVRNGFLNLRVSDNGIGIHQDDQQHVFDLFFRGQNAVNIQGAGMGLCIVKRYVVLLGGTITFTSNIEDSTTFVVQVPSM
jgi:signal transduction histidine kinase